METVKQEGKKGMKPLKTRGEEKCEKRDEKRKRESERQGETNHSWEEKEGDKQEMEVAAGVRGRLYAVLWFADEGHGGVVMDSNIVWGQGTFMQMI